MRKELYNYDIYPIAFPVGKEIEFTVKPLGAHAAFKGEYTVSVHDITKGFHRHDFYKDNYTEIKVTPDSDGCLRFPYTAQAEAEHYVRIYSGEDKLAQFSVYALEHDLASRYPLKGDFHMHTFRSDGREAPDIVCANYRKLGYDFIVITDHHRYYPSLDAMNAYKDVNIALNILPGEEVHLPGNEVHIVNAGGLFSVNGLIEGRPNHRETDGNIDRRRLDSSVCPPDTITEEQYNKEIDAIIDRLNSSDDPIPGDVEPRWYASCVWAFDKIREADGLGIFAHPYWISNIFQIPEAFTRYIMKNHPFDAFEVLGGELYFHMNGLQTALYYDEYREGRVHPIVGSTDSHGSTVLNRGMKPCHTVVFAKENERSEILTAIKDHYSVAIDTISDEYRIVGEFRLQKYAAFLMENYFPLHDKEAVLDGELMFQYATGNADKTELDLISAKAEKLMKKYIHTC